MKRKIVVCCMDMLGALCRGGLIYDGQFSITSPVAGSISDYRYCPFCGAKLPFPYEEVNMFGEEKE